MDQRIVRVGKIDLPLPRGIPRSLDEKAAFDAEAERRQRAKPCYGQTYEATKVWMKRHAKPGLIVVIRLTGGGRTEYILDEVTEVRRSTVWTRRRVSYKAQRSGVYQYTGQSFHDPKGQVDLLVPTPAVVKAAIANKPVVHDHQDLIPRAREQTRQLFTAE